MNLADRVAVVTGGASGLGRATVIELLKQGAKVAVLDIDGAAAKLLCSDYGSEAVAIEADVSDVGAVSAAMSTVDKVFGRVDICVNSAAVASAAKVVSRGKALPLDEFRNVIEVNLIGAFDVMRQCVERMVMNDPGADGERGIVVNVSSGAALQGQRGQAAYAASKAGLIGLMLPSARDLASSGVRVVTIAPGLFDTQMTQAMPKVRDGLLELVLSPSRMGSPSEFAALVRHVIENGYVNATTISIDAGIRLV